MGYVATRGGTEAVLKAEELVEYFRLKGESEPLTTNQIKDQLRLAVDRAMSEGGLYAPELAALALKQNEGDSLETSFLLRAYRSTLRRLAFSQPAEGGRMRLIRRISATFKDIPGGQILGPSRDYHLRLLNKLLINETTKSVQEYLTNLTAEVAPADTGNQNGIFPKVVDSMRQQGILAEPLKAEQAEAESEPFDITRQAIQFPPPRSARLQTMARGEVGSMLTFAYSSVRGYGDAHPTLGELRVGYLPVEVIHPVTGETVEIGEIMATECEMVSRVYADNQTEADSHTPAKFGLGYGFSFGQSEVKAISMSIIDRVLSAAKERGVHGKSGPATNEEFVLQHIDGIEASGFTAHFKLPHYVTFQADIKVLEQTRQFQADKFSEIKEKREQIAGRKQVFAVTYEDDDDE
jgi:alpha-D-ribose 1-methylphosphonate 5-triphosphate synthase subunit PhnI